MNKEHISSNQKGNMYLIFYSLLFFIGVLLRDYFELPIHKYLFVVLTILALFSLSESYIIALISFLIPFLPGLPGNYIIALAILFIILKRPKIPINFFILAAYLFLLLQLFHIFFDGSSISAFIIFSLYIVLIALILLNKEKNYNPVNVLVSYGIGVIAAFTIIVLNTLKYVPLNYIFEHGIRIGNIALVNEGYNATDITLTLDQNTLGYFCAISISIFLVLLFSKKLHPMLATILIMVTFIYGSLTLSRTFILIIVGVVLYYLAVNLKVSRNSVIASTSLFATLISIYMVIQTFFPYTIELMKARFQEGDLTNGRTEIFAQYHGFMFQDLKHFLFGLGIQNMNGKAGFFHVPHNGLQQIFVAGGIIGLLLFLIFLFGLYWQNRPKERRKQLVYLLPLVTLFVYIQALQFLSPHIIMLPLIVVICALRLPDVIPEK